MAEYIDIDAQVVVTDTRGRERETTVRHILEMNKGVYTAADVRPVVKATWKRIDFKPCGHDYECSSCGWKNDMETNFCPKCGAQMEES